MTVLKMRLFNILQVEFIMFPVQPPNIPLEHTSNMTQKGFLAHFILAFELLSSLPAPPILVSFTRLK